MDLAIELQKIYDSEINVEIGWWRKNRPLNHYHEEYFPAIPSAKPTYSPAVYAVSQPLRPPQSQELGLQPPRSRISLIC